MMRDGTPIPSKSPGVPPQIAPVIYISKLRPNINKRSRLLLPGQQHHAQLVQFLRSEIERYLHQPRQRSLPVQGIRLRPAFVLIVGEENMDAIIWMV